MQNNHQNSYLLCRWIYLRSLGAIHFVAFLSLSVQILLLNGKNGILPTAAYLARIRDVYGPDSYAMLPTIFWFDASDLMLLGACIAGTVLSICVTLGFLTGPSLILLAIIYTSLDNACGEFMAFQSDGLIVEATVLSLFLVPWCIAETPWSHHSASLTEPSKLALTLNRFLLFRLMFAAGVVKLLSGDPSWANLTALSYHQETQPIPSPIAWFVHHLPMWMHKTSAVFTFVSELVVPFFYFAGRNLRLLALALTAALHVGILLTGNYTFLNYLSIALCIPLIDDAWIEKLIPWGAARKLRLYLFSQERSGSDAVATMTIQETPLRRVSNWSFKLSAIVFFVLAFCQFITNIIGSYILPTKLGRILTVLSPTRIFNSYGMFAVMTKKRPEIVFEGSLDGKNWRPYVFKYKVDDQYKAPPVVAPHMPRLDWRLWFASMQDISENPWVMSLVRHMLKGDPAVLTAFKSNPFPQSKPKFIRAYVYDYHFTDWEKLSRKGQWWWRDNKRVYFEPVQLSDVDDIIPAHIDLDIPSDELSPG